jgi:aminoglycoside/choline kinase family phosphotransferase
MISYQGAIKEAFIKYAGNEPEFMELLPLSGSNRLYFRLGRNGNTVIAAYNPDIAENEAFIYITNQLRKEGVRAPEVFVYEPENHFYLQQDLGDMDLFRIVSEPRAKEPDYMPWYKEVISSMPSIQHKATANFDYSKCYPREAFDRQSMLWDLNYFKYHFLKLAYTPFHEQKLEDDFNTLVDFLCEAPSDFFLYRDFQSRNIMIHNNHTWFIDYQGGRRGALQYDLASLLFEAKTALRPELREELKNYYVEVYGEYPFFKKEQFLKYYPGFILIRLLQAFGTYGYRGYFEQKPLFLQSIPPAISNLKWILNNYDLGVKLPHLTSVLNKMTEQPAFQGSFSTSARLHVSIFSFSYRKGIPEDLSGNGGGHVFDCRLLPNPGTLDQYKALTGRDQAVIDYLNGINKTGEFLTSVNRIILQATDEYVKRGYKHLMISFGCTGGQHRSVFCAESIARKLSGKEGIEVSLIHRELKPTTPGS